MSTRRQSGFGGRAGQHGAQQLWRAVRSHSPVSPGSSSTVRPRRRTSTDSSVSLGRSGRALSAAPVDESRPDDALRGQAGRLARRHHRSARTPGVGDPPTVAPSRSARSATAASPRQTAGPPTGSMSVCRCRRSPTARRPPADPSTLNTAWNGTRAATKRQRRDRTAPLVGADARRPQRRARRDDDVHVVIDRHGCVRRRSLSAALMRFIRSSEINPPIRAKFRVRGSSRSGRGSVWTSS